MYLDILNMCWCLLYNILIPSYVILDKKKQISLQLIITLFLKNKLKYIYLLYETIRIYSLTIIIVIKLKYIFLYTNKLII